MLVGKETEGRSGYVDISAETWSEEGKTLAILAMLMPLEVKYAGIEGIVADYKVSQGVVEALTSVYLPIEDKLP